MEKPIDLIDQFDAQSRLDGQSLKQYLNWLMELRADLDMKIETVKGDIKRLKR
jgi:hypothetical protein